MKISNLKILTILNILFYSRIVISLIFGGILLFITNNGNMVEDQVLNTVLVFGLLLFCSLSGQIGCVLLRIYFTSKSKYSYILNIICSMLGFGGKRRQKENININLDDFIKDNKLSLILYYINNPQYPILDFDKNKIRYFTQEYDWESFRWSYKIKYQGKNNIQILEYEGVNQNNEKIKDYIDFEKINAKENEVLLLFIVHDLLFGKSSSTYY